MLPLQEMIVKHVYQFFRVTFLTRTCLVGLCLGSIFAACQGGGEQKQQTKPYSPIEGDTVDVIIGEPKRHTVGEALDEAFGKDTPQDSAHSTLRQIIIDKYKQMGDSLARKLLKGERIH